MASRASSAVENLLTEDNPTIVQNRLKVPASDGGGGGGGGIPSDYQSYWKFQSDMDDETGYRSFTQVGTVTFPGPGPDGNGSMYIGGGAGYGTCANTSVGTSWSYVFWSKYRGAYYAGYNMTLCTEGGDFAGAWTNYGTGKIQVYVDGAYKYSADFGWELSSWMHVAVVCTAGSCTLYKNGSYFETLAVGGNLNYNRFGYWSGGVKTQIEIAHQMIYARALSADEVEAIYAATGGAS